MERQIHPEEVPSGRAVRSWLPGRQVPPGGPSVLELVWPAKKPHEEVTVVSQSRGLTQAEPGGLGRVSRRARPTEAREWGGCPLPSPCPSDGGGGGGLET